MRVSYIMLFKTLSDNPSSIWKASSFTSFSSWFESLSCILFVCYMLTLFKVRIPKHLWKMFKVFGILLIFLQAVSADEWKPKRANKIIISSKHSKYSISPAERKTGWMVLYLSSSNRWQFIKPKAKPIKKSQRKKKKKMPRAFSKSIIDQGRLASELTRPHRKVTRLTATENSRSANRIAKSFPGTSEDNEKIGRDVRKSMQLILREPFLDEP